MCTPLPPLYAACFAQPADLDAVKRAIADGGDVNARHGDKTAAFAACQRNNLDALRLLVDAGADLSFGDDGKFLPHHIAASCNNVDVVTWLATNAAAGFASRNQFGDLPIHTAAATGSPAAACAIARVFPAQALEEDGSGLNPLQLMTRHTAAMGACAMLARLPRPLARTAAVDATLADAVARCRRRVCAVADSTRQFCGVPWPGLAASTPRDAVAWLAGLKSALAVPRAELLWVLAHIQSRVQAHAPRGGATHDSSGGGGDPSPGLDALCRTLCGRRVGRMRDGALVEPVGRDVCLFL